MEKLSIPELLAIRREARDPDDWLYAETVDCVLTVPTRKLLAAKRAAEVANDWEAAAEIAQIIKSVEPGRAAARELPRAARLNPERTECACEATPDIANVTAQSAGAR